MDPRTECTPAAAASSSSNHHVAALVAGTLVRAPVDVPAWLARASPEITSSKALEMGGDGEGNAAQPPAVCVVDVLLPSLAAASPARASTPPGRLWEAAAAESTSCIGVPLHGLLIRYAAVLPPVFSCLLRVGYFFVCFPFGSRNSAPCSTVHPAARGVQTRRCRPRVSTVRQ